MKNMIVTLVSGFMLLMIFCSAAFATESEDQYYNDLLVNYGNTHQKIVVELERARKNIPELMKMFHEVRRLDQLLNKKNEKPAYYSKYQEQRNALEESLSEKYLVALIVPGIHFENFNMANETQIKIDKVLTDTIAIYKNSFDCFNQKIYSGSKSCNYFQKVCANYGSDNGDMYYYELTNELELKKVDVSENDADLFSTESYKGPEILLRDVYLFCRLKSKTSSPFSPSSIRKNDPALDFKFIKNFYGRVLPFPSALQKTCIDGKPSEQRLNRLLGLWFQFPEHWLIKKYYDDYEKWEPTCNGAAQAICKNMYIIKDQIILTYPTVACKNREVTREDIENDILLMDSNAEKLKHSTLLDEIDICQKAHNSGFYWSYEEPKASDKCKKEVPQAPKKKK